MRKIFYILLTITTLLLISGCDTEEVLGEKLEEARITVDIESNELSYTSTLFTAEFLENDQFELNIMLNENVYFDQAFKLYINDLYIESDLYDLTPETLSYQFDDINEINPEFIVDVDVTFNLNGGSLTKADFEHVEPDSELTITTKNDPYGSTFTIIDDTRYLLTYFHKILIKYNEPFDAYEVVYVDPVTTSMSQIEVDDYEYVIAVDQYFEDEAILNAISSYTNEEKILKFIIFDQDLETYEDGPLVAKFYTEDIVSESFHQTLNEPSSLPTPIRDEFVFVGWFLDDQEVTTYPGYTLIDDVSEITYEARWEAYSMNDLESYLNDLIPDEVYDDISLPTEYSGFTISWSSSDEDIIKPTGEFIRPYVAQTVSLVAEVTSNEDMQTLNYNVSVIGYKSLDKPIASSYIYRAYDMVDENFFETLDIINTAFILGNSNGDLYGTSYLNNVSTYIMPEAKKHGNWVIMSVGPSTEWSTIALSPTKSEHFANQIVDYINMYGFDGVDIDWETPTTSESKSYTALMKIIYEKVKANNPHHLVTTAITGGQWQPPKYDLIYSNQYLDYINLMTYGLTSGSGQYQNPLYKQTTYHYPEFLAGRTLTTASIDESVKILRDTYQVDYDKIIVGVAFYGIKQTRTYNASTESYSTWSNAGSVYYHEIYHSYYNNDEFTEYYDKGAGVPYLINDTGTVFISYDNAKSILEKSRYIIDNDLAGIMFWEYGTDTTGILLQALRTGLMK
jgi:chitinase